MCNLLSENNLDIYFSLQIMQSFVTGQKEPNKIMSMDEFGKLFDFRGPLKLF